MAKYKIAVFYRDCNFEEIIEIEAESLEKAKEQCGEIKENNIKNIEYLKSRNIYTNRIIRECKIHNANWKEELLKSLNFLEKKE